MTSGPGVGVDRGEGNTGDGVASVSGIADWAAAAAAIPAATTILKNTLFIVMR